MFLIVFFIWMFTWSSGYLPLFSFSCFKFYLLRCWSFFFWRSVLKQAFITDNHVLLASHGMFAFSVFFFFFQFQHSLTIVIVFLLFCFLGLYVSGQVSNAAYCWGEWVAIKMHFSCFSSLVFLVNPHLWLVICSCLGFVPYQKMRWLTSSHQTTSPLQVVLIMNFTPLKTLREKYRTWVKLGSNYSTLLMF